MGKDKLSPYRIYIPEVEIVINNPRATEKSTRSPAVSPNRESTSKQRH